MFNVQSMSPKDNCYLFASKLAQSLSGFISAQRLLFIMHIKNLNCLAYSTFTCFYFFTNKQACWLCRYSLGSLFSQVQFIFTVLAMHPACMSASLAEVHTCKCVCPNFEMYLSISSWMGPGRTTPALGDFTEKYKYTNCIFLCIQITILGWDKKEVWMQNFGLLSFLSQHWHISDVTRSSLNQLSFC